MIIQFLYSLKFIFRLFNLDDTSQNRLYRDEPRSQGVIMQVVEVIARPGDLNVILTVTRSALKGRIQILFDKTW